MDPTKQRLVGASVIFKTAVVSEIWEDVFNGWHFWEFEGGEVCFPMDFWEQVDGKVVEVPRDVSVVDVELPLQAPHTTCQQVKIRFQILCQKELFLWFLVV